MALVTWHCPVCDRPYQGATDAEAKAKVVAHLGDPMQDEAHLEVYNAEGWWNDYGN